MSEVSQLVLMLIAFRVFWQTFQLLTYRQLILLPIPLIREFIFFAFIYWFYYWLDAQKIAPLYIMQGLIGLMVIHLSVVIYNLRHFVHKGSIVYDKMERYELLLKSLFNHKNYLSIKRIVLKNLFVRQDAECLKVLMAVYENEGDYDLAYSTAMLGVDFSRSEENTIYFLMAAAKICSNHLKDNVTAIEHLEKCFEHTPNSTTQDILVDLIDSIKEPKSL